MRDSPWTGNVSQKSPAFVSQGVFGVSPSARPNSQSSPGSVLLPELHKKSRGEKPSRMGPSKCLKGRRTCLPQAAPAERLTESWMEHGPRERELSCGGAERAQPKPSLCKCSSSVHVGSGGCACVQRGRQKESSCWKR